MLGLLKVVLVTLVPWIELRGSIPLGIAIGLDPLLVFFTALLVNVLIIPLVFVGLDLFYNLVSGNAFVRQVVERTRNKATLRLRKYGLLGLLLFVAVPLPGTGAYSGALAAWLFGLDRKKSFTAIALGVTVAGLLVLSASVGIMFAAG